MLELAIGAMAILACVLGFVLGFCLGPEWHAAVQRSQDVTVRETP